MSRGGCAPRDGLRGVIALVTGANRGLGRELVAALLRRGAGKVYAASRAGSDAWQDPRVVPLLLDITDPVQVAHAARRARDLTLLVNNAGVNAHRPLLGAPDLAGARAEMETNYFGTLAMCRAFAPVLAGNGGGGIVNVLSLAATRSIPGMGSLCASKAAALRLTECVRAELAAQRTFVAAFLPGALDTDMTHGQDIPKASPADAAAALIDGLLEGIEDIRFAPAPAPLPPQAGPAVQATCASTRSCASPQREAFAVGAR